MNCVAELDLCSFFFPFSKSSLITATSSLAFRHACGLTIRNKHYQSLFISILIEWTYDWELMIGADDAHECTNTNKSRNSEKIDKFESWMIRIFCHHFYRLTNFMIIPQQSHSLLLINIPFAYTLFPLSNQWSKKKKQKYVGNDKTRRRPPKHFYLNSVFNVFYEFLFLIYFFFLFKHLYFMNAKIVYSFRLIKKFTFFIC